MRRTFACIGLAVALTPGMSFAQEAKPLFGPVASGDSPPPSSLAAVADRTLEAQAGAPVSRPGPRPRRRPSMVGYIEDSSVLSQLRLRFDAGFGNTVPDRAEYFYAKCGCYIFDPPPAGDVDAPGPGGGVPTELNFQQLYLQGEYAANGRASVFVELPFRFLQPQGFLDFGSPYDPWPDASGIGDIRAGAKFSLMSSDTRQLTAQLRAGFPTGKASRGLGSDLFSLEPALLFHEALGERAGIEAQFGTWLPFGGSAGVDSPDSFSGNILYYGIGPSFDAVTTSRFTLAPVVELVGWHIINGFETNCAPDLTCTFDAADNVVNLKVGARATVNGRSSFYVGYGFGLTDAKWYDDIVRVEYRLGF